MSSFSSYVWLVPYLLTFFLSFPYLLDLRKQKGAYGKCPWRVRSPILLSASCRCATKSVFYTLVFLFPVKNRYKSNFKTQTWKFYHYLLIENAVGKIHSSFLYEKLYKNTWLSIGQNLRRMPASAYRTFYNTGRYYAFVFLIFSIRVCGAHLRVIAPRQHSPFQRNVAAGQAVDNTVSDLTGPRCEP